MSAYAHGCPLFAWVKAGGWQIVCASRTAVDRSSEEERIGIHTAKIGIKNESPLRIYTYCAPEDAGSLCPSLLRTGRHRYACWKFLLARSRWRSTETISNDSCSTFR